MSAPTSRSYQFGAGLAGLCLAVCLVLVGRLLTLELFDLIDPTESRYASVAQEMVLQNNWLVPLVPGPSGVEPYLGKPPLHFWMTALSYSLFGVDEWTARLPSFFSLIVVLASIWILLRRSWSDTSWIYRALLICLSIPVFFFLAGSSVIDVTLTAFISLAIVSGYLCLQRYHEESSDAIWWSVLATISAALAFLTKGPVAVVLVVIPLLGFLWMRSRLRDLLRLRWVVLAAVFLAIVSPWFLAAEQKNPGFVRYFIWNENIARYLFKEYGDKYGSGHVHSYGSIWLMFLASAVPWILVLIFALRTKIVAVPRQLMKSDDMVLLGLAWTLAPLLFFTFVRQLHVGYLVPALPGFAVFVAATLRQHQFSFSASWLRRLYCSCIFVALVGAVVMGSSPRQLLVVLFCMGLSYCLLRPWACAERSIEFLALSLGALYFGSIWLTAPWISQNLSSGAVLNSIVTRSLIPTLRVGSFTDATFSLYWEKNAWKTELGRPITVAYVDPTKSTRSDIDVLLVQQKYLRKNPDIPALREMIEFGHQGQWAYFVPKDRPTTLDDTVTVSSNWDQPIWLPDSNVEAITLGKRFSQIFH